MIIKSSTWLWLKFLKQQPPKMSFRNLVKWFQKTLLEPIYKKVFCKSNLMTNTKIEWKMYKSLKMK